LNNGNFAIADETGALAILTLLAGGGGQFAGRLTFTQTQGISFSNFVGTTGNSYGFGWNNVVAGLASISVDNGGVYYAIGNGSDERMKMDIAPSKLDCLDTVMAMPVRKFRWLDMVDPWQLAEDRKADRRTERPEVRAGVIAQEINKVFPEGVRPGDNFENHLGAVWGLDIGPLFGLLVGAIQQQSELITSLTARVAALEGV
jgi:hypothetical protein